MMIALTARQSSSFTWEGADNLALNSYMLINLKRGINMDISTNNSKTINEFESNVLSAVAKILELEYANVERSGEGEAYRYEICGELKFSLQFTGERSLKACFSTNTSTNDKNSNGNEYGYNLQINENYEYCGPDFNITDKTLKNIIKDVESENGHLLNITKKILGYML